MPAKNSKNKTSSKNEKPKQKMTISQIAFGIFAVLLIIVMLLSLVSQF